MIHPQRLTELRTSLGLSQEAMARLLGISFASVNRWEKGASGPTGVVFEVYRALDTALKAGIQPKALLDAPSTDPGQILHHIFNLAYGAKR